MNDSSEFREKMLQTIPPGSAEARKGRMFQGMSARSVFPGKTGSV
jgi:hypothetical protein